MKQFTLLRLSLVHSAPFGLEWCLSDTCKINASHSGTGTMMFTVSNAKSRKKKVQLHQPASHIGLGRLASSTNRSNSCLAEWMCPQKSTVLDLLSENTQLCHLCPTQCHSMVRKSTTASNREQWSLLVPLVIPQHGLGR